MAHITAQSGREKISRDGDGHIIRVIRLQTKVTRITVELCIESFLGCSDTDFKCVTGGSDSTVYGLY